MALSPEEQRRLRSFRSVARQVRDASVIAQGRTIEIERRFGDPGYVDIFVRFLEEEPFRSLALAVRLAHLQGEPANFAWVCNLLHRKGTETIQERAAEVRRQYAEALRNPDNGVVIADGTRDVAFSAGEVFDHWLNGVAFHQDADREEAVRLLKSDEVQFSWSVQATVLQLAGRILDLDDIIADHLGEPRVPRIGER